MYHSTQGSGRKVSRLMPMTPIMVLIAAIPSQPASKAVCAGYPTPPHIYTSRTAVNFSMDTWVEKFAARYCNS